MTCRGIGIVKLMRPRRFAHSRRRIPAELRPQPTAMLLDWLAARLERCQQDRVGAAQLGQPVGVVAIVFGIGLADQPQLPGVGTASFWV